MQENLEINDITKNIEINSMQNQCENIKKAKKHWNNDEIDKLTRLYVTEGKSLSELLIIFPNRTIHSIHLKIKRLKLKHSVEQKKKIWAKVRSGDKNPMFGKSPPTKGKTKETMKCLKNGGKKLSNIIQEKVKNGEWGMKGNNNPMFGKVPWNKGLTKETDIRVKKYGEKGSTTLINNHKNLPDIKKMEIKNRMAYIGSKCKKKNTFIELQIQNYLNEINTEFESNYIKDGFSFDIYLPKFNLIIECQGDYWHRNPEIYKDKLPDKIQTKNIDRDKRKIKYFNENNYRYLLLWENDIRKNFNVIKEKIQKILCT